MPSPLFTARETGTCAELQAPHHLSLYRRPSHDAALQDAASIAGLRITTEAMVAEVPKKQPATPAMPAGGMGGRITESASESQAKASGNGLGQQLLGPLL